MGREKSKEKTKAKMLDAGEAMFAKHGVDGASVRAITGLAGVNLSAVNYHFDSKENLAREILRRKLVPFIDEVAANLDEVERSAGVNRPELDAVLRAYLLPYLRLQRENADFIIFMAQLMAGANNSSLERRMAFHANFQKVNERFMRLLFQAQPELPREEVAWRRIFITLLLINLGTHRWFVDDLAAIIGLPAEEDVMVENLIKFFRAGLLPAADKDGEKNR